MQIFQIIPIQWNILPFDNLSFLDFEIKNVISKGVKFYLSLFENKGEYLIPKRYDKRYMPHNTWLFVKTDGRDIAEALIFFSKFYCYIWCQETFLAVVFGPIWTIAIQKT